jgi:hypothetical protein
MQKLKLMHKYSKKILDSVIALDKKQILLRISRKIYIELAVAQDNELQRFKPSDTQLKVVLDAAVNARKKFHVVGNSHAHSFTGSKLGQFGRGENTHLLWDSYSLGPLSSLDLINRKWQVFLKIIENAKFEQNDRILMPFGEAECRWYALKEIDSSAIMKLTDAQLKELVTPYLEAAFEVFRRINELGFTVCTWSGHISSALPPREDPITPIYGNFEIRVRLIKIWREEMKKHSLEHGYQFLDFLNNQLKLDKFGLMVLADEVHLDSNVLTGFVLGKIEI